MVVLSFTVIKDFGGCIKHESILATDKEDGIMYLDKYIKSNFGKDAKLGQVSVISNPTHFSIFSHNPTGNILVINWKDECKKNSGRVSLWTKIPKELENQ